MSKRVKGVTLTILTESPVPLSYDQGYGNYTPMKKEQYGNKLHAKTSIATITYELRKVLHKDYGWKLSDIVLNKGKEGVSNLYADPKNIESVDEYGIETDVFGYFVPKKDKGSLTKVSPLRIIPFRSLNSYDGTTQLITNRGFLELGLGRNYKDQDGKEVPKDDKFPSTQALAVEEVMGDYYTYTITLELDRIGVVEVQDGKLLLPEEKKYMSKEIREKAVKDILDALTVFTRNIKHSSVLLKPIGVFGGAFSKVVPYFWNDIRDVYESGEINLYNVIDSVKNYDLEDEALIVSVDGRLTPKNYEGFIVDRYPVKAIRNLADKLEVGEDNFWYVKE